MDSVAKIQQTIYETVWTQEDYRIRCHGLDLWQNHRDLFPISFDSALDIGCGLGFLFAGWNEMGIDAWGFDHAVNCLDKTVQKEWCHKFVVGCIWHMEMEKHFDFGICTDVMEHIPEDKIPAALERIMAHCDHVLFKISNIASEFMSYNLHPTRKPAEWWWGQIYEIGGNVERIFIPTNRDEYFLKWERE